jgi:hypothetical protein
VAKPLKLSLAPLLNARNSAAIASKVMIIWNSPKSYYVFVTK